MGDKDNGGMAFPMYFGGQIQPQGGMTLRDYFAANAMQGAVSGLGCMSLEDAERTAVAIPYMAYVIADAMLAERAK